MLIVSVLVSENHLNKYLVDISLLLLTLFPTADGSSILSCGSESINNFFIGDYRLSFCSENTTFPADINKSMGNNHLAIGDDHLFIGDP